MAKGSVRKKGKKWYYRFYIEDESGKRIQKEYVGTESKSETERLLRKAMESYEQKNYVAVNQKLTVGELLDMWIEEEVKPGNFSNGTVSTYLTVIKRIKQHPIGDRKLKTVTADHLQTFMDFLSFGGTISNKTIAKPVSSGYLWHFSAVLQGAFRFAVFPKRLITFNPMPYVKLHGKKAEENIFSEINSYTNKTLTITHEQYLAIKAFLMKKHNPALLPIQIAYYTGLRLGEVCGLAWQDINLEKQYLNVQRSMRYIASRHKIEMGPPKRRKTRTVYFCDSLAMILKEAKNEQRINRFQYGELYNLNYYKVVWERTRIHYEIYTNSRNTNVPDDYNEIELVCIRSDGAYEKPNNIQYACNLIRKNIKGLTNFHFHMLRHTYTSNLLAGGANPTDVQELLGHSNISTTLNVYAHSTRDAMRNTAKLMDMVAYGK